MVSATHPAKNWPALIREGTRTVIGMDRQKAFAVLSLPDDASREEI